MFVATDLHGHTHFSDGRATPEEYVELRRQLGMKAIAICDHDVLGAVRRGAEAAARANMLFLPAMEVTSFLHFGTERAEQFHVLAYFPASYLDGYRLEQTALYRRGMLVQERWKELVLEWLSEQEESDREALDGAAEGASLEKLPAPLFPALQSMILRIVGASSSALRELPGPPRVVLGRGEEPRSLRVEPRGGHRDHPGRRRA
jgi:DNA polymerase III alpha subunit